MWPGRCWRPHGSRRCSHWRKPCVTLACWRTGIGSPTNPQRTSTPGSSFAAICRGPSSSRSTFAEPGRTMILGRPPSLALIYRFTLSSRFFTAPSPVKQAALTPLPLLAGTSLRLLSPFRYGFWPDSVFAGLGSRRGAALQDQQFFAVLSPSCFRSGLSVACCWFSAQSRRQSRRQSRGPSVSSSPRSGVLALLGGSAGRGTPSCVAVRQAEGSELNLTLLARARCFSLASTALDVP